MDKLEKNAKQSVLKGIVSFMSKLNAEKFKPKPEPKVEVKPEEDEVTPEMLEKLKSMYADKSEQE